MNTSPLCLQNYSVICDEQLSEHTVDIWVKLVIPVEYITIRSIINYDDWWLDPSLIRDPDVFAGLVDD